MIYGVFLGSDYETLNYKNIEDMGLTDVIRGQWAHKTIITDYTNAITDIQTLLGLVETTSLKTWTDLPCFLKSSPPHVWAETNDLEHLDVLCERIINMMSECETLEGVFFDDFDCPNNLNPPSSDLIYFAGMCKDAVNSMGGKLGLTACYSYDPSFFAEKVSKYEPVSDYVSPMIYKHAARPTDQYVYDCVNKMADSFVNPKSNLLPLLITYDIASELGDLVLFSEDNILNQMRIVLREKTKGYILYSQNRMPDMTHCLQKKTKRFNGCLVESIE